MLNRRAFLGWTAGILGGSKVKPPVLETSPAEAKEPVKVLGYAKCPKCDYWMHLPRVPKYSQNYIRIRHCGGYTDEMYVSDRVRSVPITCSCNECGYTVTEDVLCDISPRVESGLE